MNTCQETDTQSQHSATAEKEEQEEDAGRICEDETGMKCSNHGVNIKYVDVNKVSVREKRVKGVALVLHNITCMLLKSGKTRHSLLHMSIRISFTINGKYQGLTMNM